VITLLTGENSFEIERALQAVVGSFDGVVERIDGSALELKQLPDLLMGGTLFADKRLVVVKGLSDNKSIWPVLSEWLARLSDDIHLVLVETKPDKRTKTYKDLQKAATVQEFKPWTERDTGVAEQWVVNEAARQGVKLDKNLARFLVGRVGADQWSLYQALLKLKALPAVNEAAIATYIDVAPAENVFNLFEAALNGKASLVAQMLGTLELTEDPYRLFGLLSGQAFQLAALAVADKPTSDVAKDIGAHPYALGKLAKYSQKLGRTGAKKVVVAFAEADAGIKTSAGDPWLLIERALVKTAQL
jgi:DNA polymerase III delta subunit